MSQLGMRPDLSTEEPTYFPVSISLFFLLLYLWVNLIMSHWIHSLSVMSRVRGKYLNAFLVVMTGASQPPTQPFSFTLSIFARRMYHWQSLWKQKSPIDPKSL